MSDNPYAIVPPVGRLLEIICEDRSVGGSFRPGNRELARRMGLNSAGSIPGLIAQLVNDGWISYDRESGVIMLLRSFATPKRPKRPKRPRMDDKTYQAEYRARNRVKLLAKSRAYAAAHRIERAASYHATLARRRGDSGRWTAEEWRALCEWFGSICLCCGSPDITVDHVIPKGRRHGGKNVIANLQPLCKVCNFQKHDRAIDYRDPDPDRLAAFLESIGAPIDQCAEDQSIDHADRVLAHQNATDLDDRSPKATESACMVLATASTNTFNQRLVVASGGMQGGDQSADHPPPAASLMAELGANPKIIREAYESRPDWTPAQVRQRWAYDQKRIAVSDGRLNEGVFFTALRSGELAPARPDPQRPLDPPAYAGDSLYRLGSDTTGLGVPETGDWRLEAGGPQPTQTSPQPPAPSPQEESIGDIARRLLPPDASTADWVFVQTRLARGDTEAGAVQALSERRRR